MSNEERWIASFLEGAQQHGHQGLSDLQALQLRGDLRLMPLRRDEPSLLQALPNLGSADYTTGNTCASCTRRERVQSVVTLDGATVLFGEPDGMRWMNTSWRHSVAVLNRSDDFTDTPPCLLLFGEAGELAHHITIPDPSAWEGFIDLVRRYRGCWTCLQHGASQPKASLGEMCPAWLLREAWRDAGSDRDLDLRLERLGLSRVHALRAMEGLYTTLLDVQDLSDLLKGLASVPVPAQVQLGNRHCLQILESPLDSLLADAKEWEVQMGHATLRLNPSSLDSIWLVIPPWTRPERPQIECYDAAGERVLTLSSPLTACPLVQVGWQQVVGRLEAGRPI